MITMETKKLDHLEQLLLQSSKGVHLLFDHEDIAYVLSKDNSPTPLGFEQLEKIQTMLTTLIAQENISAKRQFLETLTEQDYELVMRAYFNLLDSTLQSTPQSLH